MSARFALAGLIAALALGGCGGVTAADLFVLTRSGPGSGARLTLLVNEEGGVRCNGGPSKRLSDPQLVQARAIQEDLHDYAVKHFALHARSGSVFGYVLRDVDGAVTFADNSPAQPAVLRRLQLFVVQVAQQVCGLAQ